MVKRPDLNKVHVLVADGDRQMAEVLQEVLRKLGLGTISLARNGRQALEILKSKPTDIVITEWEMEPLDGMRLIKALRYSEDPYFALMPIIMLTARATAEDVIEARDMGVTEFLVKPYTTKSLYKHLEHVIDFPRDFIVSDVYVGPDRRRGRNSFGMERRIKGPVPTLPMKVIKKKPGTALALLPQKEIRKKAGLETDLKQIITPELLAEAQATINSFQEESLQWIGEDLVRLEQAMHHIIGERDNQALEDGKSSLLSIKSRAGTFGYDLPAKVSYDLYNFLRKSFELGNMRHNLVMQKHIEVVKILLAKKVTGSGGEIEKKLQEGLTALMDTLAA